MYLIIHNFLEHRIDGIYILYNKHIYIKAFCATICDIR